MPWGSPDAIHHTKEADTPEKQERWAKTATGVLNSGMSDASAIKIANWQAHKPVKMDGRYRSGGKK